MKGSAFGDRARMLAEWFQDWNSCEQTIALYSLLSKVSATQARFLSLVLEHSLKNGCDSAELSKLEKQANNSAFLSSLHSQSEEQALTQLLAHLPLLNPGNIEARREYMKLLPKVMLGSSEELDYLDQCRQLLSLALVHPAFPHEDREALTYWLSQLDRKQKNISDRTASGSPQRPPPIPPRIHQIKSGEDFGRPGSGNGRIYINGDLNRSDGLNHQEGIVDADSFGLDQEGEEDVHSKTQSLQHGQSLFGASSPHHHDPHTLAGLPPASLDDLMMTRFSKSSSMPVPRTASLSSLPGSNVAAGTAEETTPVDWKPGMKDVPLWLKSLRLHKYQHLFAELSYEEMLTMQEEYLEQKNVTRGARTKIILSIRKLARRPETLTEIEQDIEKHGRLVQCINELRQMLLTPIKPYSPASEKDNVGEDVGEGGTKSPPRKSGRQDSGDDEEEERPGSPSTPPNAQPSSSDPGSDLEELLAKDFPHEDLPSLVTRAMGKAYHQLMLHTDTNEENLSGFLKLLDMALQHEAFTVEQKNLFFDWKQQCNQTLRILSPKKPPRGRHWGPGFYTIHAMPSATSNSRLTGAAANKTRSLRSPRGSAVNNKGLSLPNFGRSSSTLPRMSARQLQQQPLPHHAPSFLRPKSNIFPSAAAPTITGAPMSPQATPLLPPSQQSAFSVPPPVPPRHYEVYESEMDLFCERVTAHVIDDSSDN